MYVKMNSRWIKGCKNPKDRRMGLPHFSDSPFLPLKAGPLPIPFSLHPAITAYQTPREKGFIPNLVLRNTVVINSSALATLHLVR